MRTIILLLCGAVVLTCAPTPEAAIRGVLEEQVQAWNEGDLARFVRTYSAETVFVRKEVTRGNSGLLERYRRIYPTRERMGTLTFSDLEVKMLGRDYASVLGRYHLKRTTTGGGDAQGIFTLLQPIKRDLRHQSQIRSAAQTAQTKSA
jgi:uncharacterized protein (TIGR02246 family)